MVLVFSSCGTIRNELGLSDKAGLTYNKLSISEADLDSDMKALAKNEPLVDMLDSEDEPLVKDDKLSDTYRASWANIRMRSLAIKEVRIKNKMKITSADKKSAKEDAKNLFAGQEQTQTDEIWDAFPKSFQNSLIESFAEQYALLRAAPEVTDAEIKKYFEENQDTIAPACDSGKTISHILVSSEDEAKAKKLKKQIDDGEDFAKLAEKNSIDPGSKDSGGSLGCYTPGNFVAEFERAAAALQIGAVSEIVETEYGFHILKATKYVPPTLKESKDSIREALEPEKQTKLFDQVQTSLKKAKVTVLKKYGKVTVDEDELPKIVPLSTDTTTTSTTIPEIDELTTSATVPAT